MTIYCCIFILSFAANFMIFIGFDLFTDRVSSIGTLTFLFNINTVSWHLLEKTLKINKDRRCIFFKSHYWICANMLLQWPFQQKAKCICLNPWSIFPSLPLRYNLFHVVQLNKFYSGMELRNASIKTLINTVWIFENEAVNHGLASIWHILERKYLSNSVEKQQTYTVLKI